MELEILEPYTVFNQHFLLEDVVTPLALTPYSEQLKIKENFVRSFISQLKKKILKTIQSPKILPIAPSVRIFLIFIESKN